MTTFGLGAYGFGLLAGVLSTLSPCVLPILPILLGSASAAHPKAPLALAGGLALSYAAIGTTLAAVGSSLGVDGSSLRIPGALVLGTLGLVLMSSALQQRFAAATASVGSAGNALIDRLDVAGMRGQFVIGLALGIVWSPCVGPTLGAAIVVASQGTHLAEAALLMAVFGLGAAVPVLVLAWLSRTAARLRGGLIQAGKSAKALMGGAMLAVALLILTGTDKLAEAWLVDVSPMWLTALTTRF